MTTPVETRLRKLICDQLGVEEKEVSLEKSFVDDLGADSLDIVELTLEIEDQFRCTIPDDEAGNIRTVGDAVKLIGALQEG